MARGHYLKFCQSPNFSNSPNLTPSKISHYTVIREMKVMTKWPTFAIINITPVWPWFFIARDHTKASINQ